MDLAAVGVLDVRADELSHDERLDLLEQIEHLRSAIDAQQQQTLALLAREGDADIRAKQWVREEVAGVLSVAPMTAASKLVNAVELVDRLPRTLDRLVDGSITMGHVRVLLEATRPLDDETTAAVEGRVIARAEGTAIGEFRQLVKRSVLAVDPRTATAKHEAAVGERRVRMFPDDDGMAVVWAYLRGDAAMGLMTVVDAHAAALPSDDERTMDQKRADVLTDLADLALANAPGTWQGRRPAVQLSVAFSTVAGLDEQPGELDGYGPIPASLAREIAHDPSSRWRRVLTDHSGRLLRYGRRTYRPPAGLRDHVIARDRTCTFPGCRRSSCRGEIDHVVPFPLGTTDPDNLHPACKRHHDAKHQAGWRVGKDGAGTMWTSPTGRSYLTEPTTYPVDTTTDPDPPPF